ncbi:MAG: hypothetical protein JXA07_08315 [Spirochaetes bacterium]|nr:hypothetical protein [Spirochaetota bacterium]
MIIYTLFFCLLTSFTLHAVIIALYVKNKDTIYFFWFIATVVLNMGIALALITISLSRPDLVRQLNLKFFFWLLSGFVTILLLCVKIVIFRNIFRRSKDPRWYHFNHFGKKVFEKGIVKQVEFIGIFGTLPFFLFIGAYFMSRLLNMLLYGHM